MNKQLAALTAGLFSVATNAAFGLGIEQSRTNTDLLFMEGSVFQFSATYQGSSYDNPFFKLPVSDNDRLHGSVALKYDISEQFSLALVMNEPYGFDRTLVPGFRVAIEATAFTLLGKYDFGNGFSAIGGLRGQRTTYLESFGGFVAAKGATGVDLGFVLGVGWENETTRVAVTYDSKISQRIQFTVPGSFSVKFDFPPSYTLNAQHVVSDTLSVWGQLQYIDYTKMTALGAAPFGSTYSRGSVRVAGGVDYGFAPNWTVHASVHYETGTDRTQVAQQFSGGGYGVDGGLSYDFGPTTLSATLGVDRTKPTNLLGVVQTNPNMGVRAGIGITTRF